ncbi:hypothetical protein [Paenibacillus gansuensis]|uniref:Uncharacterized protein n=1 Tax=Paenibacillus gansuensis TaxID=306542 RepID=A0ABW5PI06_9BACL
MTMVDHGKQNSSFATKAALTFAAVSTLGVYSVHSVPSFQKVSFIEETGTPGIVSYKKLSWIEEAQSLFPVVRDFTKEESEAYEASLDSLFTSTGNNFFDYVK